MRNKGAQQKHVRPHSQLMGYVNEGLKPWVKGEVHPEIKLVLIGVEK